jgi:hypothetical protein
MDQSNRRVVKFLEKEIKTYTALSLFLSKKGVAERLRSGRACSLCFRYRRLSRLKPGRVPSIPQAARQVR